MNSNSNSLSIREWNKFIYYDMTFCGCVIDAVFIWHFCCCFYTETMIQMTDKKWGKIDKRHLLKLLCEKEREKRQNKNLTLLPYHNW